MKNLKVKIINVLSYIFGLGVLIALAVGALSFLGYLFALIIGGDIASLICVIIYEYIYPVLFSFTSIIVLLGLVKMYVAGEKSMAPKSKNKVMDKEKIEENKK